MQRDESWTSAFSRRDFLKSSAAISASGAMEATGLGGLLPGSAHATQNVSGVSRGGAPISLPKGGGAIRGIGETFQPNLFTGTGNFSVPIATSPGRNGFGPQLALQYSSGNGNGPFGIGWQLSIPRITRKTEKGLPSYTDDDVFVISGAEDLVPFLKKISGNQEKWEPDTIETESHLITRYRPRTEGLFARIERWVIKSDRKEVHWRATTKENVSSIYGRSVGARIFDPEDSSRIYEWLLEETFDAKGNHIYYEYIHEPSDSRTLALGEREPYEQNRRFTQAYVRRILYGNVLETLDSEKSKYLPKRTGADHSSITSTGTKDRGYLFELLFDYGDLPDPAHTYRSTGYEDPDHPPWWDARKDDISKFPLREDRFSSFRSGFEIRTLRRCKRILMLHHFKEGDLIGAPMVKSTSFAYDTDPHAGFSVLKGVTVWGHQKDPSDQNTYRSRAMPPVTFAYSEFKPTKQRYASVTAEGNDYPPRALNDPGFALMDVFGDGLPDIVNGSESGYYYWQNLGNAHIDRRRPQPTMPAGVAFSNPKVSIGDMGGDGLPDVIVDAPPMSGFYEATPDGRWKPFKRFDRMPTFDLADPNTRLVDLTGDSLSDVLVTRDAHFLWFRCLGEAGYDDPKAKPRRHSLDEFPDVYFNDPAGRIRLADMSGDGLSDIVMVHDGRIEYWPNKGYCRWGGRIIMKNSPRIGYGFDPKRLFLADLDGTGCADVVYVDFDRVHFWFNQSGNSFSKRYTIEGTPYTVDSTALQFADFFGTGTACLIWSYDYNFQPGGNYKILDFCGSKKPHLLVEMSNNMGATTRAQYASSTKFYLEDKRNGRPWVSSLPFPVHVLEKTEVIDNIAKTKLVTKYSYHHGYYDGHEREFRGFGRVDQIDTEEFQQFSKPDLHDTSASFDNTNKDFHVPPVLTRTWYHTGAFIGQDRLLHQYRNEYFQQEQHIPGPSLPAGLSAEELREYVRALKGLPLRQEVYSFDGAPEDRNPYTVTENNFEVRWLQPRGERKHGVFFPVGRESVSLNYERDPTDPRVSHKFGLELDEYGNARKACSVVYGRKVADPTLPAEVTRDQQKRYITYAETDYTPDIGQGSPGDTYRLRVPFESRSYEVTGVAPAGTLFQLDELRAKIEATAPVDYEVIADGATPQKRLFSHGRTVFLDNALNPLPLGQWDSLGLAHQSYKLAFTPGVTAAHYAGKVTDAEYAAAGYVNFAGDANWWLPSGTAIYPADPRAHFYLPIGARDSLGVEMIAKLDPYDLLTERVEVKQAAWNVVTTTNDYRVLGPVLMTDPNKNRTAVEHDSLGMVVKTVVMGKAGSTDGDTLADPTTRMEYELFNWMNNRKPNYVHTFAREQHGAANSRWQESYAYSNGSGGVAMVKAQAHPGKAFKVNADGTKVEAESDPRWVGNGRTILNNKGKPVKQYEPYFSTTHEYEDDKVLREIGVTPILYYDPVGRNIRTLFPNGTFARVEFNPWLQKVFDANDTVKQSQWYADRGSPDPATQPEPLNDPGHRAAWLAAKHADTPGVIHFDSLGRPIYAISDYGGGKTAAVRSESDLTGRLSRLFDQEKREVASGFVGMAGTPMVGESAEKGRRWTFQNALGALVKTWDQHGRQFRAEYDTLHRPVSTFVQETRHAEILFNYVVYGDRLANAEQLNLLGTAHRIFDQAGMVRVPEVDFKGNPKSIERVLAKDYKNNLDWSALPGQPDVTAIQAAADPALEVAEVFTASSQYDALNRPTQVTLPDGTVILPRYNEANFLASLRAQIRGQGAFIEFLKKQDYDAKGQRQFAQYGNDVFTRYFYDPNTFRLTNLLTYKSGVDPQTQSLQNLNYTYDPVGNITQIRDNAQQTHYFNNAVVKAENLYEYDAIYQLVRATGRELAGGINDAIRTHTDLDFVQLPHPNNLDAVRKYTEEYEYDLLGNIKVLTHRFQSQAGIGDGWKRHYRYAFDDVPGNRTNRLKATSLPGDPDGGPYNGVIDYDACGNMTRMPHLATLDWNFMDQLHRVDLGGGGTAHYVYGLGGQRLRKVIERNGNLKLEWIFLGAVMIFRRRRPDTNDLRLERWTVHISDNGGHIAQIDTKIRDDDDNDPANPLNAVLIRYQYANHLGSAVLQTDEDGKPISYEEYHPHGTTAYRSVKPGFDLSLKRYRFSGKERDDETGLYYFGARYYAPWLGRWTSGDP
jgi:RHS repeat-associated protein